MNLINLLSVIPNGKLVEVNTVSVNDQKAFSVKGDVESIRNMISSVVEFQEVKGIEFDTFDESFVITLKGFDN